MGAHFRDRFRRPPANRVNGRIVMRDIATRLTASFYAARPNWNTLTPSRPLKPLTPTTKPLHRGRNTVQRGAAKRRPLIGFPTGQFPVCRTPPRFPQQPFLRSNTRRLVGHSIKPTRRFRRDIDAGIDLLTRLLLPMLLADNEWMR